jgi:hypothetical protein
MQNVRPTDLAPAANHLSPVNGAINRVVAIAPAPLRLVKNRPTTLAWQWGSSKRTAEGCD